MSIIGIGGDWKIQSHFAHPPYRAEVINGLGIIRNKNGYNCASNEKGCVLFPSRDHAYQTLLEIAPHNEIDHASE